MPTQSSKIFKDLDFRGQDLKIGSRLEDPRGQGLSSKTTTLHTTDVPLRICSLTHIKLKYEGGGWVLERVTMLFVMYWFTSHRSS